jgi:hypothetical protein
LKVRLCLKVFVREKCKRKQKYGDKFLEVNITINDECLLIFREMLCIMEKFIDKLCVKIVYFGERRDSFKTSLANGMHVEKYRERTICSRIGGKKVILFTI